jgi:5'-3' exoribonuclease 2
MNQQRSRRFRASKEASEKLKEVDRIRDELIAKGCEVPPAKEKGDHFDSNCITPVSRVSVLIIFAVWR